jgi:hypothetical protein
MCSTLHILHVEEYQVEDIRRFETCKYERKWWLVCVLQVNDNEIKLTFLYPSGPSKSFMYPLPDILWVPASKVLIKVDPETATSHTYVISVAPPRN